MRRSSAWLLPAATALFVFTAPAATARPPDRAAWDEIARCTSGPYTALALAGNVAFVGAGARLEAVDQSDPAQPSLLAHLDLPSGVTDLAVRDGYVHAAVRNAGLAIVDARRPGRLKLAGWVPSDNPAWDRWTRLEVVGDAVYCTGRDLTVVDIGNPARPRVIARIPGITARDVAATGDRLYVACNDAVRIYNIATPSAPALLATIDMDGFRMAQGIQVHDGRVYLMSADCLVVWSLAGPLVPETTSGGLNIWGWGDIAFHGANAYVAGATLLRLADYSDSGDWYDWYTNESGPSSDVDIAGDLMVVTHEGLTTYSLAGSEPQRLGVLPGGATIEDLTVAGGRAWLAAGYGDLCILDITNPRHPRLLGSLANDDDLRYERARWPGSVRACRQHALLYAKYGGLRVVDGTDPAAPQLVFSARALPDGRSIDFPEAITVADGWIVSCRAQGTSSSTPVVLGLRLDAAGTVTMTELAWPADVPTWRLRGDGRLGYAIDPADGLVVFEASAAGPVRRLGAVSHGWRSVRDVTLDHGFAYIAHVDAVTAAVDVVDVSDPATPRWRGTTGPLHPLQGLPEAHLGASDGMVLIMNDYGYVGVIDATRPDAPVAAAPEFEPGAPWSLAAADGLIFVGSATDGLRILRLRHPAAAPLAPAQVAGLAVTPNPCNPRAVITFTTTDGGPATVRVFDARGRLVRQVHDGWLDDGPHSLPWPGDDDGGRPVASGVYLVRVHAGERTETARMVVVR